MRILLDACVPRQLARELREYDVATVVDLGLGDLDDAPLLDAAADRCDVFVTVDKSLPSQQRISARPFGVVVLRARSNRLADLLPLIPPLRTALAHLGPGSAVEVRA